VRGAVPPLGRETGWDAGASGTRGSATGAGGGAGRARGAGGGADDCPPGTTCRILRLMGCGAVRQRLLDLGIRPEREVTVLRNAPLNDPIELMVGDSYIVIRRREAAQIEIAHV